MENKKFRRLRANPHIRSLVSEVEPRISQLIQPLFVVDGINEKQSISGLTGVFRETPSTLLKQVEKDLENGVTKFLLFSVPKEKSETDFNYDFTLKQISELKKRFGDSIWLALDVCLCSATTHGQCGIVNAQGTEVLNDLTVDALATQALKFSQAGANCVAPSDMMDGRIGAIRKSLDIGNQDSCLLMSYSAKFHSKFYGPFREAADSAPKGPKCTAQLKDRSTYQIEPGNYKDALNSSWRDFEEGADILMVKPAMPYLDVLYRLSQEISAPWAVYQVSGEFAAIEVLAEKGLIDREAAHHEALTAFVRAGAQMIITYGARNFSGKIK
jgi:porphobilinogen synthase